MKHSPLRYYGGKSRGLKALYEFFPSSFSKKVMVDVFGGSWVVSLNIPNLKRAIINDYYSDLQNFWWVVRGWPIDHYPESETRIIKDTVEEYEDKYPLYQMFKVELDSMVYNVDYIHKLTEEIELTPDEDTSYKAVLKAAKFYLVNRIKYSGMQSCKDTSGFHSLPGGNVFHETLDYWHEMFKGRDIRIWNLDFRECLKKVNKMTPKTLELFIYLDPPYVEQGAGYAHNFNEQDHRDLAEILMNTKHDWVLSYDDCPLVRELYEKPGIELIDVQWEYSSTKGNLTSGKHELIITNIVMDACEV